VPEERRRWTEGLTGYHYLVLVVACLGWSFDTLDQWLFVYSKEYALKELLGPGASDGDVRYFINVVTACLMIGWATGGLIFGMVGDRLGRTRTMAVTILVYAVFTGLSGLAQTWQQFAALRFLTGLGVGGEFAAGAALVAETFPAHARATALSLVQATSALGNITAGFVTIAVVTLMDPAHAWRWVFGVGIVPALLVVIIFLFVREPEKWHQAREDARQGKAAMGSIFGLFREPQVRRNTLIGVALATVGVIGFWGMGVLSPELNRAILQPEGYREWFPSLQDKQVKEIMVVSVGMCQNFGSFFGSLLFAWLALRIGRRWSFAISLLACLIIIPTAFAVTSTYAQALLLFFGVGFALLMLLGGFAVYFPELFPTRLRSTGTGFCYNVARYLTAFAVFFSAGLLDAFGYATSILLLSSVFVLGLLVLPFAPDTKGKPLPE